MERCYTSFAYRREQRVSVQLVVTMKSEYKGYIEKKCELVKESDMFSPELYSRYDVKKGLRDSAGNGVIVGLTRVSQVDGS